MTIRLPKSAAAIMSRIRVEDEQRQALKRSNAATMRRLKAERGEAESRLAFLEKAQSAGQLHREVYDGPDVNRVADASPLEEVLAEIADLDARIAKLANDDAAPRMTAARLELQLDEFSRYVSAVFRPSLNEGESLKRALTRIRGAIEKAKDERKAVASAGRTYDEVRERVFATIASLAGRGVPKVLGAFRGGDIEMPQFQVATGNPTLQFVPDGAALVAWLFQSELERRVDALLEFNRNDEESLSASEQTTRLQEIDERLMALYREEESAIVEAIVADGGNAFHFADRPALAVLGIRAA